jgi:hypothetical protein
MNQCIAQNQPIDSGAAFTDALYWVYATLLNPTPAAYLPYADSLRPSASNGRRLLIRGIFSHCI